MTPFPFPSRRAPRLLLAALAVAALGACNDPVSADDDGDDHGHADEVASMRLAVTPAGGATTIYALSTNGVLTPSPLRLPVGAATVAVDFLDEGGAVITDELHDDEYEFRFTALPAGVTFARSGAYAGTFSATTAGTGTMRPLLWHLEEGHEDLGPWPIAVQIGD